MRASELLGRPVVDHRGRRVGIVHDVRVRLGDDGGLSVSGLVVGPATARARLAHAWGYAQDRAIAPALLRSWLLAGPSSDVVPAARVHSWDEADSVVLREGRVAT